MAETASSKTTRMNAKIEPRVNGITWIREAKASDKPPLTMSVGRRLLASTVEQGLEDMKTFRSQFSGRRGMTVVYLTDMNHLVSVLEGQRGANCGFVDLPEGLDEELGTIDFDTIFIFCVALEDADVALISKFYLDVEEFMNA